MDNGLAAPARCQWANTPLSVAYHDAEWGVPLHDDRRLFEFLILEGAQAGLSWELILRKREAYRAAFDHFDPVKIAAYDHHKTAQLLTNPGIIRNRLKIAAAITNAQAFLKTQQEHATFDAYIWQFVNGVPIQNAWSAPQQIPAATPQSAEMSRQLRRRGFRFVGPTICYAFMQATGMVNDHTTNCHRHPQLTPPA